MRESRRVRRRDPDDLVARQLRRVPSGRKSLPGEFELIARLTADVSFSRRTILGPGDDCAIIRRSSNDQLITIDSMVENVHFKMGWGSAKQTGIRALEVNLSDIAAMGGTPHSCVVNLAVRPSVELEYIHGLNQGLRTAARRARVDVVGGNITSARELSVTIALLGDAARNVLRRDAARIGDDVFVTGTLGDAALGWRLLAGEMRVPAEARQPLVNRYLEPAARVQAGSRLARLRPTPAAIDISDGLLQDLGHILERSKVGAEIDAASVPISEAYRKAVGNDLTYALSGGEDYELLFCASARLSASELTGRLGVAVTRIGRIVKGRGFKLSGAKLPLNSGFDQLRARRSR